MCQRNSTFAAIVFSLTLLLVLSASNEAVSASPDACIKNPVQDAGMTSQHHSDNVGQIVFATSHIKFGSEPGSQIIDNFVGATPIYGRAYFAKSMANTCVAYKWSPDKQEANVDYNGESEFMVKLKVNGKEQQIIGTLFSSGSFSKDQSKNWTTSQMVLQPSQEEQENYSDRDSRQLSESWTAVVSKLPPGTYEIELSFVPGNRDVVNAKAAATGTFTLVKREGDDMGSGSFPESAMKDRGLQRKLMKIIKTYVKREGWKEVPKKLTIIEDHWTIQTHHLTGQPVNRVLKTAIGFERPNKSCVYGHVTFIQDHKGGGRWSKSRFFSTGGLHHAIPCKALK